MDEQRPGRKRRRKRLWSCEMACGVVGFTCCSLALHFTHLDIMLGGAFGGVAWDRRLDSCLAFVVYTSRMLLTVRPDVSCMTTHLRPTRQQDCSYAPASYPLAWARRPIGMTHQRVHAFDLYLAMATINNNYCPEIRKKL